jgi:hypothetical protein
MESIFLAKNISVSKLERAPSKSRLETHEDAARVLLILMRARGLCVDLREELERADQDDDEYCLLLSNCADDLAGQVRDILLEREARCLLDRISYKLELATKYGAVEQDYVNSLRELAAALERTLRFDAEGGSA